MMRFVISPATFLGMYILLSVFWSLHQAIVFTTQGGWGVSWAFVVAVFIAIVTFSKLD